MDITLVNKSTFSDEALQSIIDFLAPCFGRINLPVRITFKSKPHGGAGAWGVAYWPSRTQERRVIKPGEYTITVNIGTPHTEYPVTCTYKKRAGARTCHSFVEEIVHTVAHEMRHVEQFEACRNHFRLFNQYMPFSYNFRKWERNAAGYASNSCEVDAELVAHGLLGAYHTFIQNSGAA